MSTALKLMQCFPLTEVHQQAAGTLADRFNVTTGMRLNLCPTLQITPILYCTDRLVPADADMMQLSFPPIETANGHYLYDMPKQGYTAIKLIRGGQDGAHTDACSSSSCSSVSVPGRSDCRARASLSHAPPHVRRCCDAPVL